MNVKTCFTIGVCLLLLSLALSPAMAQTAVTPPAPTTPAPLPANALFVGAGLNTSISANRPVGSGAYLHQVSSDVYMFARYDMLGISKKPFAIQTVVTAGACQILHQLGPLFVGACLDGGTAVAGTNIGGAIGSDGLAGVRFGKKGNFGIVVMGGIVKTALSDSITPIRAGFVYGW